MKKNLQILHLEDDDLDAEIIKNILQKERIECNIMRASCKKEYFSKIQQNDFDIILADYSLPDYNGLSALKYAKEHKSHIPFIFVSGTIGEEKAVEALRCGAKDYVLKQHINKLAPAIQRVMHEAEIEKASKESEEKYRSFFENSMDAILLASADGIIFSANQAACGMLGYREEELIELGRSGIVDMTDPRVSVFLSERTLTGKAHGELTLIRKDGTRFPVELTSAVFKDLEGFERASLTIRDITERKNAEHALRESEEKFSNAFRTSPYGIAITSLEDGIFIEINEAFTSITGFTQEEAISNSSAGLKLWVDLEDRKQIVSTILTGKDVKDKEILFRKKNGDIITGSFCAQIIHINNKSCILTSIIDITERKHAEEKLLQQMNELRRWQEVTLGREDRNMQLKAEVNKLLVRLGEPIRYPSRE